MHCASSSWSVCLDNSNGKLWHLPKLCVQDCKSYVEDPLLQAILSFSNSIAFQLPWWQRRDFVTYLLWELSYIKDHIVHKMMIFSCCLYNLIASNHNFITWLQRFNWYLVSKYWSSRWKEMLSRDPVCLHHNVIQHCVQRGRSLQAPSPEQSPPLDHSCDAASSLLPTEMHCTMQSQPHPSQR